MIQALRHLVFEVHVTEKMAHGSPRPIHLPGEVVEKQCLKSSPLCPGLRCAETTTLPPT
jgi:hypothetical protein